MASGLGASLPFMGQAIYLDYNATTPIWPEVADAMRPYLECFGNPSSGHAFAAPCRDAVALARRQVAALVGASPEEIQFCSCGTEADNWAVWGAVAAARLARPGVTPHVVTSAVEHPAILEHLQQLQTLGLATYTAVGVTPEGLVRPADVAAALVPGATALVTVQHANNEVGALQPVAEIAAIARRAGALMHSDAAQSVGKVPVDVSALGVDLLSVVGHKLGAPKGCAALYIREGVRLERLLCGGGQERGRRAGTESVLLIAGLGAAAAVAEAELPAAARHAASLRGRLEALLVEGLPPGSTRINGPADPALRLPNTLSIGVRGLQAAALLHQLRERLAASAGAACHSAGAGPEVSGVLRAMGVPLEFAAGTLRLSVGRHSTVADVEAGAALIIEYCATLTTENP
jgi:cysteine desulfurase